MIGISALSWKSYVHQRCLNRSGFVMLHVACWGTFGQFPPKTKNDPKIDRRQNLTNNQQAQAQEYGSTQDFSLCEVLKACRLYKNVRTGWKQNADACMRTCTKYIYRYFGCQNRHASFGISNKNIYMHYEFCMYLKSLDHCVHRYVHILYIYIWLYAINSCLHT